MTQTPKPIESLPPKQGDQPPLTNDQLRRAAIEQAFDYRGDVTIETTANQTLEGYIFDRVADAEEPCLRLIDTKGIQHKLLYTDVVKLHFSGRDTASGTSWETWIKKYAQEHAQKTAPKNNPQSP